VLKNAGDPKLEETKAAKKRGAQRGDLEGEQLKYSSSRGMITV